jgi:TPR repeat protein
MQRGFYGVLILALLVALPGDGRAQKKAKAKPQAPAIEHDSLTEWELINGAALEVRDRLKKKRNDEPTRRQLTLLAIRSARGAERALAEGNATLFDSYRSQVRELFADTRWRLGQRAKQGEGVAEFALGVFALHGFLDPPDRDAACKHFSDALDKGFGGAKFRLSLCLQEASPERAARYLHEAAEAGHPMASELKGRGCLEAKPQDLPCAYERLTVAAAAGRPSAQSLLAWMYTQGVGGRKDPERALRLYLLAAKAGDLAAQNNAGEAYEMGRGVTTDFKVALDWYRKAAGAGFAPAQFNLGRLYANGQGTEKNPEEARRWLESAEKGGVVQARQLLESMNKNAVDVK